MCIIGTVPAISYYFINQSAMLYTANVCEVALCCFNTYRNACTFLFTPFYVVFSKMDPLLRHLSMYAFLLLVRHIFKGDVINGEAIGKWVVNHSNMLIICHPENV